MMLTPLFLAILIFATMSWSPCRAITDVYIYKSHLRQQGKIKMLSRELLLDAETKIRAVQRYRDQYYKSLQYQLGDIVYEMRDYFKKMVKLYIFSDRNISYGYLNHNENVRSFVLVHRMATVIETKVNMVHEWQFKRASAKELHVRMSDPLRMGPERDEDSQEQLDEAGARARMAGVRARMARAGGYPGSPQRARAPPAAVDAKRKNKKWQHVRGYELG